MPNKSVEVYIRCPFYLREGEKSISCEGVAKNTCLLTRFPSEKAKRTYERTYCAQYTGGDCFLARNLYRKYEDR